MDQSPPKVSVGVPVYNGAATLKAMLESLLQQSFSDFEIVISDNASTDETGAICADYTARDSRIRYIRQPANIGGERNFKFVLDQARGTYFMWSASDDTRSPDYLEENVRFLEGHPDYAASTCPNCFEGCDQSPESFVTFGIDGDVAQRFNAFLDNSWISHGIFYAVFRTEMLRGCEILGHSFLGSDWAIDLYVASRGGIHRTKNGLMVSGRSGVSSRVNIWKQYRAHPICWILPFYRVSFYAIKLASALAFSQRLALIWRLLKLNMWSAYSQLYWEFHPFYSSHIKPWLPQYRAGSTRS
jgi:glycosyltransferase involved in cell wall biosynthesis